MFHLTWNETFILGIFNKCEGNKGKVYKTQSEDEVVMVLPLQHLALWLGHWLRLGRLWLKSLVQSKIFWGWCLSVSPVEAVSLFMKYLNSNWARERERLTLHCSSYNTHLGCGRPRVQWPCTSHIHKKCLRHLSRLTQGSRSSFRGRFLSPKYTHVIV